MKKSQIFGRQAGFTLIEMSIVLVIIGLIIGGILKGQEIIESSRSKNVLAEIERIRAAANTFYDRYAALPGDFSLATTRVSTAAAIANGNGNGVIGTAGATNDAAGILGVNGGELEKVQFWNHLAGAKLVGGVTPSTAATTFGEASAAPAGAFPGTGYSLAYGNYADLATAPATAHWLRLSKGTPAAPAAGMLSKQVQQIDVRIDDGIPVQGAVRTGIVGAPCGTAGGTPDYVPTTESVSCVLFVNLIQ